MNTKRSWKTSEYTKSIGIKPDRMKWIEDNKIKKSKAGFLDTIIDYYIINHK